MTNSCQQDNPAQKTILINLRFSNKEHLTESLLAFLNISKTILSLEKNKINTQTIKDTFYALELVTNILKNKPDK